MCEAEPLVAAFNRFGQCYLAAMTRRFCWRLGVESRGTEPDSALIAAAEKTMREGEIGPDLFFFRHRGGREASGALAEALAGYQAVADDHPYWSGGAPEAMLIDEVEAIWSAIAERDDWQPLADKVEAVRRMAASLFATSLPMDRPPWELRFVTGLDDGRVAVIERVHHALVRLAQDVTLHSSAGAVEVQALSGQAQIDSSAGSVHVRFTELTGDSSVKSSAGSVEVRLPANTNAALAADSSAGHVTVDNLTLSDEQSERDHVTGTLGSGVTGGVCMPSRAIAVTGTKMPPWNTVSSARWKMPSWSMSFGI